MLYFEMLIKVMFVTTFCQSLTICKPKKHWNEFFNSTKISKLMPSQSDTSTQLPQFHVSKIYPTDNKNSSLWLTMLPAPEQPVLSDISNDETLHKIIEEDKQQPLLSVDNNYRIYHIKTVKRASPWANNKQKEFLKYFTRKRNSKENHEEKLIDRSIEEQQSNKIKQPPLRPHNSATMTSHEIRYLHDIFLNYPKHHHVNFGHVELAPDLFEKRFESQKATNRYKGEIKWLDNTGGFVQHSWDLAQGRL